MIVVLAVVSALAGLVALAVAWHVRQLTQRVLDEAKAREETLRRQLSDANNRLFAAWSDGKVIPPSDLPFVDPVSETPLAPELLEFLAQYEDLTVRAKYERMMRAGLAKQMTPLAILKTFETPGV